MRIMISRMRILKTGIIVSEDNQSIDHTKHNYFWGFGYGQEIDGWDFKLGYIGRVRNEDYLTAAFDKVDGSFELSPANRIITIQPLSEFDLCGRG